MSYESRFRSPEGMQKFLEAYNTVMALWTVPYESIEVETSYGTTHVFITGDADAPPMVLIHGGQISSPVWYPNIEALSRHFRVYVPDVVDQMGLSSPTKQLKTAEDCAAWIDSLLDALNLERATFVGHSHGGWQLLNMAIRHPERIEQMILLSPAASFTRFSMRLFLYMLPVLARPTPAMFYWSFQWMTVIPLDKDQPNPLIEQFMAGALSFKPDELSLGVVYKFRDDDLRQITIPTLLLIGEEEVVYAAKPYQVIERAKKVMPHIEAHLIPNSKHLFPVSQANLVNERMLNFLQKSD